jgi:hypothetical protein
VYSARDGEHYNLHHFFLGDMQSIPQLRFKTVMLCLLSDKAAPPINSHFSNSKSLKDETFLCATRVLGQTFSKRIKKTI